MSETKSYELKTSFNETCLFVGKSYQEVWY